MEKQSTAQLHLKNQDVTIYLQQIMNNYFHILRIHTITRLLADPTYFNKFLKILHMII
jgi:hypothetical protein